jgi:hypothetical protein
MQILRVADQIGHDRGTFVRVKQSGQGHELSC